MPSFCSGVRLFFVVLYSDVLLVCSAIIGHNNWIIIYISVPLLTLLIQSHVALPLDSVPC